MEKQIAILIDGDNISAKYAEYIKQEAMEYGNVKIFRLYGSVNSQTVKAWYKVMPLQGIVPVLQISYASGKSIADQALTIDAMDLLYSGEVDYFCIVSSDCDFTKLVYRLKEAGKTVIGMGEKKTKEALAKACDEFKILDLIYKDANDKEEEEQELPAEIPSKAQPVKEEPAADETKPRETEEPVEEEVEAGGREIDIPSEEEIIAYICDYLDSVEEEKINLADIGRVLKQKYLGFDSRNYGYRSMTKMIKKHSQYFQVESQAARDGIHRIIYICKKENPEGKNDSGRGETLGPESIGNHGGQGSNKGRNSKKGAGGSQSADGAIDGGNAGRDIQNKSVSREDEGSNKNDGNAGGDGQNKNGESSNKNSGTRGDNSNKNGVGRGNQGSNKGGGNAGGKNSKNVNNKNKNNGGRNNNKSGSKNSGKSKNRYGNKRGNRR